MPRDLREAVHRIVWIGLAISSAGCGGKAADAPKLYRVTGTVTYKGQPVPEATVMFLGDGSIPPAVGQTDSVGGYNLASMAGLGAVAGNHIVTVRKEVPGDPPQSVNASMEEAAAAAQQANKPKGPISLIPAKYADAKTSGLQFEVTTGTNEFAIELKD